MTPMAPGLRVEAVPLREHTKYATSVDKNNITAGGEASLLYLCKHTGKGLASVHRVQHQPFQAGQIRNQLEDLILGNTVTPADVPVHHPGLDIR